MIQCLSHLGCTPEFHSCFSNPIPFSQTMIQNSVDADNTWVLLPKAMGSFEASTHSDGMKMTIYLLFVWVCVCLQTNTHTHNRQG